MVTANVAQRIETTIAEWRVELLSLDIASIHHKPTPDRWSIAEIVGHLVDSACNNHQRFVRALNSKTLRFPKYDQNAWVASGDYDHIDWPLLVELWCSYNGFLAHLIRKIPKAKLATVCTIVPYESCTLEFVVVDYFDHLQHHLQKIRERTEPI